MTRGSIPWVVRSVRDWSLSVKQGTALVTYRSGGAREEAIRQLTAEFEHNAWRSETLTCGGCTAREFVDRISKSGADVLFVLDPDRVLFGENNELSPFWISFQRETIVEHPGVQIWWMLPNAAIRFGRQLPDVSRFFLFREELTDEEEIRRGVSADLEIQLPRREIVAEDAGRGRDLLARALRAAGSKADAGRVWLELGVPAIDAFLRAGQTGLAVDALTKLAAAAGPPVEALKGAMTTPDARVGGALLTVGRLFHEIGRWEEALAPTEEAVRVFRRLGFLPQLGTSVNNTAKMLSYLGRPEEALAQAEEAVRIRRRLAEEHPDAFLPALAMSVNNLASRLSDLGRQEEALAQAEESVRIYRQLAEGHRNAFVPDLAMSVNNLAKMLSDLGRREEALVQAEESVRIRRQLAGERPDAFLPDLARSLAVRGSVLAEDQPDLAMYSFSEAIRLLTPIFSRYPQALARLMREIREDYVKAAEASGVEPDATLLAPITAAKPGPIL